MEWLSKIFEWLKLPARIIAFIALMSCAFLFLPSKIIETLKLQDFIDLYGKYFGVVFIVASSYLLFIFLGFVFSKVKSMFINLKNNKNAKENSKIKKQQIQSALCDLTQSEKCLLREFYLQGKDVIKVIYETKDKTRERGLRTIQEAETPQERTQQGIEDPPTRLWQDIPRDS